MGTPRCRYCGEGCRPQNGDVDVCSPCRGTDRYLLETVRDALNVEIAPPPGVTT